MKFSKLVCLIAISLMAVSAYAQSDVDVGYQNDGGSSSSGLLRTADSGNDRVVILNNANATTATNTNQSGQQGQAVQQQPTTYVQAQPVSESRAEAMRKAREHAEVQTEQKIVEKLEQSRLDDEHNRADRLFGNRFESPEQKPAPAPAPVVVAPAPVAVAPAPVKEDKSDKATNVTIEKVEINTPAVAETRSDLKKDKAEADDSEGKVYIGASLGTSEYDANNVKNDYAYGFTLGEKLDSHWSIEALVNIAKYKVDTYWQYPLFRDLNQYDFGVATKYTLLPGKVQPYIGGSASYIYRKYDTRVYQNGCGWGCQQQFDPGTTDETTYAVDLGLMAGLDVAVTPNILIGADFRYSVNVFRKTDNTIFDESWASNVKPLEELDHYNFMVNAKYLF